MNSKRLISLTLALVMLAFALASCDLREIIGSLTDRPTSTTPSDTVSTSTNIGTSGVNPPDDVDDWESKYQIISIAKALELCGESGNVTTERYYVRGTVVSVDKPQYGAMTITDGVDTIYVYGTYSEDGSVGYADMESKPYKGDEVLLYCILQNYEGTKEIKNARLIDFKPADKGDIDESDYTEMTVAEARDAAEGTKIKTSGVVASITYANGMKPSGVYIVDSTGSIYVYDGDIAGRAKVGNTVTLLASKTYWILDKETNDAKKHGYKGCCQLDDATLLSITDDVKSFDKSWIKESTVKDILETPVGENITTNIYKVNALVSKQDGKGFVNYYFNDLDGKTGSYAYTQCNGSDFAWLDKFDGKICTVYLSPINAKSTASGCVFRFLPIAVEYENFVFDTSKTAEHIVKYYGADQFLSEYSGNPNAELITSVSSKLLGFEGATLSYASSNESVIRFTVKDGKTYLECLSAGSATVTITGTYGENTYSQTLDIKVSLPLDIDYVGVADAIAAEVDDELTVKGIVGPSLVNKDGFYLIDENGIIAVLVKDKSEFEGLSIGDEVIIKGSRDHFYKADKGFGETCINNAEIAVNNYGSHEYSTASFIEGKTLADFYALDANIDYSTKVYVLKAVPNFVETNYYTGIQLKSADDKTTVSLYCSSGNQYSWLKQFNGQEITVEIAPCNWNGKTFWAGCVLAVRTDDGKIFNELNFAK